MSFVTTDFSKFIAIHNGFSEYFIPTHAEAWFNLIFNKKFLNFNILY